MPEQNAEIILSILKGKKGPQRDIVLLNAAFAIVAGKMANSIKEGISIARGAVDGGAALEKLNKLVEMTNR